MANQIQDIYDVSKYTNKELYNILDLNNPSDRELEAKIHFFINKYENEQSINGQKLYIFFNNVYAHFFDLSNQDENTDDYTTSLQNGITSLYNYTSNSLQNYVVKNFSNQESADQDFDIKEGFEQNSTLITNPNTSNPPITYDTTPTPKLGSQQDLSFNIGTQDTTTINPNSKIGYTPSTLVNTKSLDFTPGRLNPILKETIKRIISIDSQYRDQSTFPLSTYFTFNLSDTLIDVVSLKLYSIQLPYTWYTINKDFGSNFFYIKGISPGIDDGNSDYKIKIPSGNYTVSELITAVNNSIKNLYNLSEINLSGSDITYDSSTTKSTITLQIEKIYNDINYELYFPSWTSPGDNNYEVIDSSIVNKSSRFYSIPGFLGLPNKEYTTYNVYSNIFVNDPTINTTQYYLDTTNNYFNVILYTDSTGTTEYTIGSSYQTFLIKLQNTTSINLPATTIMTYINNAFAQSTTTSTDPNPNYDLSGSTISIDNYTINNVYSFSLNRPIETPTTYWRYKINIKINRRTNRYKKNMKAIILFPQNDTIWLTNRSCFNFKESKNELNNIISEVDTPITVRSVSNSPYIYLKCNKNYYGNNGIIHKDTGTFIYDNSTNPINIQYPGEIFENTNSIPNTLNIIPLIGNIYISKGNYTLTGDEYTIENKITDIYSGNVDISGTNYNITGGYYNISGNALINGKINVQNQTLGNTTILSTSSYDISGTNYNILGNTIQANTTIQGSLNLLNGNCTIVAMNSQTTITGQTFILSGNSFLNGTRYSSIANVLYGNAIVGNIGLYNIIGNNQIDQNKYKIIGNTQISGLINLTGNVNAYNLINAQIRGNPNIYNITTDSTVEPYYSNSTLDHYIVNGNINITGSGYINNTNLGSNYTITNATNYNILGQDPYAEQLTSIQVNSQIITVSSGNVQIVSPNNNFTISANNYLLNGNINISGQINAINANTIQIYSDTQYAITNFQPYLIIGNTYNIQNNSIYPKITILGNSTIQSSEPYIVNSSTINPYSIDGNTYISENISLLSGNLLVKSNSPNSYIITGNAYSINNSVIGTDYILNGNSYIVSGNTIINGNNYDLLGNINIYQNNNLNDYIIDISNSSTNLLPDYLDSINRSLQKTVTENGGPTFGSITLDTDNINDYSNFKFDIHNIIDVSNYSIELSNSFLCKIINLPESIHINNLSNNTITREFEGSQSYIINDSNNTIKIKSIGQKNKKVPDLEIIIPTKSYENITTLQDAINEAIYNASSSSNTSSSNQYNINLSGTNILLSVKRDSSKIQCIFTINIQTILNENNYSVYFYDDNLITNHLEDISCNKFYNYIKYNWTESTNSWYEYLNLSQQKYDLIANGENTYAEILGSNTINSNKIILTELNNYFYIQPIYDACGGVYTTESNTDNSALYNNILIKIPINIEQSETEYTKEQLINFINSSFNNDPRTFGSKIELYIDTTTNLQYTKIRLNINTIFTAKDFMLDFYDPVSFTTCTLGISGKSSVQNVLWDATLGWILGFRNTQLYYTTPENVSVSIGSETTYYNQYPNTAYSYNITNNEVKITGDTCISVYLYNYCMIILDDYVQNHLNDGLVTITNSDYSIPLPSYANRATFKCDPITKKPIATSVLTNYNNLTAKQLYSANEILNVQQTTQSKYSSGPFVQDIFGLIPIKVNGLAPGTPYIEFGGTLQLQERSYFGPVNIRRMTIKLVTDKGNILDLNGANWSFSLICEQLYTNNNKK